MNSSPALIAVVDDEEPVRKALKRLLRSAGLEVETFDSGEGFLRSADDHEPHCLILDLHMPDMTGFDVQARLTKEHAGVPIIVITGHDSSEARERALAGGAAAYLRKPIEGQLLIEAISCAIREAAAGQRSRATALRPTS